jgi:hypothetical protein
MQARRSDRFYSSCRRSQGAVKRKNLPIFLLPGLKLAYAKG